MESSRVRAPVPEVAVPPPAQVAKGALRRLALAKAEPTPENYARAYAEELGAAPRPVLPARSQAMVERLAAALFRDEASRDELVDSFLASAWSPFERLIEGLAADDTAHSRALAGLIERLVRGLERTDRQWTRARKKDSVQTVLDGSRADARRLQQRLSQLVASWEDGSGGEAAAALVDTSVVVGESPVADGAAAGRGIATTAAEASPGTAPHAEVRANTRAETHAEMYADQHADMHADKPADVHAAAPSETSAVEAARPSVPDTSPAWAEMMSTLVGTLVRSLPADDARSEPVGAAMQRVLAQVQAAGPAAALGDGLAQECGHAERLLKRRNQLLLQMHGLCEELTAGLTDLAEDDSWARGQCDAMREKLEEGLTARGVRSVSALLHTTRTRQRQLREEREQARDALKSLIHQMLQEVGELGSTTGRFHDSVGRYAEVIESADSLESLAGVVREMVAESHTVQGLVSAAQQRLHDEHARTSDLAERVQSLEDELRRLSDEVSTDQLTQIANRRGLIRAFDAERARAERGPAMLSLGLLDVDNFKRLNDELGHTAGDLALKALADRVQQTLRPTDTVARYGGEEFVVMLPNTPLEEAQQVLSRMQRAMTQALFMHEARPIFVTFSAGVTAYRDGERLEEALERADEALYDAKRTGKNRTCVG